MELKEQIISMLMESTGRHFLDSGGYGGRHWEINRKAETIWKSIYGEEKTPAISELVSIWDGRPALLPGIYGNEFSPVIDLYHFLCERLDTDSVTDRLNAAFDKFSSRNSETWANNLEGFCKRLGWAQDELEVGFSYGEDNLLSQDIQFWLTDDICILQVHGGADIRGGWSKPKFFLYSEDNRLSDWGNLTAIVEPKVHYDDSQLELIANQPRNESVHLHTYDAGYHWDTDGYYSGELVFTIEDGEIFHDGRRVELFAG